MPDPGTQLRPASGVEAAAEPGSAQALDLFDRGNRASTLGRFAEAAESYQRCLAVLPDHAEAHLNLGNALKALGQSTQAIDCYRRALAINSDFALAWSNIGAVLNDLGHSARAVACCTQALQLAPNDPDALYNLANSHKDLWRLDQAVRYYRLALVGRPHFPNAAMNLGNALAAMGQFDEALDFLRKAVEMAPASAMAHTNLANVLKDIGQFEEAVCCYQEALSLDGDHPTTHSSLLFCLSHGSSADVESLLAEHRRYGARFASGALDDHRSHHNTRNPDRKLQIGFVSADFRRHAVASLFEELLQVLRLRPALSLHAYSNHPFEDEVTLRLKEGFSHWNSVSRWTDVELAAKIREDDIDILVDLSGHTGGNRLPTFARRPAPVQASWLGYPGTTGLAAVDYYFADHNFLPDDSFRKLFTEQIVYLPATATFKPMAEAPPVNALPALSKGHVTFGSFNRMNKISLPVVALWSELLHAIPGSRMMLVGIPDASAGMVANWFRRHGISLERLSVHPRYEMPRYLSLHGEIDLCLDTFPYSGATTSAHALWMGVPTLTLVGDSSQSRVCSSILHLLDLKRFISTSRNDFVRKGMEIASDLGALAQLRQTLRMRFADSPASRPEVVTPALERAFRLMWRRWCDRLPPISLDASH